MIRLLLAAALAAVTPAIAVAGERGLASFYGAESGPQTASGEPFRPNGMTAAHRTLPFGTRVKVCRARPDPSARAPEKWAPVFGQEHAPCVIVRINDRGPFVHGRVIDLSYGAARALGILRAGVGPVTVEVLR